MERRTAVILVRRRRAKGSVCVPVSGSIVKFSEFCMLMFLSVTCLFLNLPNSLLNHKSINGRTEIPFCQPGYPEFRGFQDTGQDRKGFLSYRVPLRCSNTSSQILFAASGFAILS